MLLAAHFCNWEWLLLTAGGVLHVPIDAVYKPQRMKGIDEFLRARRARFGGNPIPHQNFMFEVMKRKKDVRAYAMVADHTPKHDEEKHWTRFLNQDTAFFVGADKIAKILKAPVIYVAMRRDAPGYYSVELKVLAEPPYDRDSGPEIVERYVRTLEEEIGAALQTGCGCIANGSTISRYMRDVTRARCSWLRACCRKVCPMKFAGKASGGRAPSRGKGRKRVDHKPASRPLSNAQAS